MKLLKIKLSLKKNQSLKMQMKSIHIVKDQLKIVSAIYLKSSQRKKNNNRGEKKQFLL